jgi:phage gp29-like protein
MRSIKTTTGVDIQLDGDLLAILEALFHEVTAKVLAGGSFEEMNREINHLVSQMSDEELRAYLVESLFLNQVKYENDRLESYMRKLQKTEPKA